jgi:electron transfer flavoprotein beta subunit
MKIAVCVKHVPDRRTRIDPVSKRIDRTGSGELNNFDLNAIEEALRTKERIDEPQGTEVVVVSMGPSQADESLRTALGLGADRAILVADDVAVGSDLIATAKVLSVVLEREAPDVVLFGQQTSDGGGALLWAAVAERLRLPVVSQVTELTLADGKLRLSRQTESGDDVIECRLPAVVAVTDAINEPRYASLKGMMGAKRKPLEVLAVEDLRLEAADVGDAGSKTTVLGIKDPPSRADAARIEDEDDAAEAILRFLVDRDLV